LGAGWQKRKAMSKVEFTLNGQRHELELLEIIGKSLFCLEDPISSYVYQLFPNEKKNRNKILNVIIYNDDNEKIGVADDLSIPGSLHNPNQ